MPLGHEPPSSEYKRELKAVARSAQALLTHLPKINLLPPGFPLEQVEGFCKALFRLPDGTAEGSIAPLRAADSELNRIRQRFIPAHDEEASEPEPLVARESDLDLRLVALTAAVRSAIERYKVESGDVLDTDIAPDQRDNEAAANAVESAIAATEETAAEASVIGAAIDKIVNDALRAELATERMLVNDSGVQAESAAAALKTEAPRPNVIEWLADGVDTTAAALERRLAKNADKLKRIGKEAGDSIGELLEINFPKVLKSLKVVNTTLGKVVAILREGGDGGDVSPPFDYVEAYNRLLRGEGLPVAWAPHVTELDFHFANPHHLGEDGFTAVSGNPNKFSDLALLKGFTSLRSLGLRSTQVADLGRLSGLASLQLFVLSDTRVADLAPLNGLTSLQSLYLTDTLVADLTPLEGLTSLQTLSLTGTQVADLTPLEGLTRLQTLYLSSTQVTDLDPLRDLTSLESLDLTNTQVTDLAPLNGLTSLQTLRLNSTPISDIAPLKGLTSLQSLDLSSTQVKDLDPLEGLTSLQSLDLWGTPVVDLAPLAKLANLRKLDLMGTKVTSLAPLAKLANLRILDLTGTKATSLAPLNDLTELEIIGIEDNRLFRRARAPIPRS